MSQKKSPSMDAWLEEAKKDPSAQKCGMYLVHNGTVRASAKAVVRDLIPDEEKEKMAAVASLNFSYDAEKVEEAIQQTYKMEGIFYIKVWLNEGILEVGDDIMYVLIGGDIRPHVVDALQALVGTIKNTCVVEQEIYAQ